MERLNPLNDYLFLKLMGEEGSEAQCLAFLNAVLSSKNRRTVKLIKILENKTFSADIIGDKSSILDVRAETDIGEKINIEVQLKDLHNMEKRTLMYWGREFIKGISASDDYKDLPKVITINIVNFDNIKLNDFHTCFHLWEDEHHDYLLTDALEIHFINMVKFRKAKNRDIANKPLERWLSYFDITTPEEILQEVILMDSAIKRTNDLLNFVMQDKEALRAYHMREMAQMDWATGINTATDKGIAIGKSEGIAIGKSEGIAIGKSEGIAIGKSEGIAIGKSEGREEIARKLKDRGRPLEEIAEDTGLDIEAIKSLL